MTTIIPSMKWAQRKESIFITINVTEIENPKVDVTPSSVVFTGNSKGANYSVTINFYKDIDPEKSKWSCSPRCVLLHLQKDSDETWPQLLKDKNEYKNLLKIDWDLWADSDNEDEKGQPAGDFQLPANFQDMMGQYNANQGAGADMPEDGECGCGHDDCHCEDKCESSDSEDSDEIPPMTED